MKKTLIALGVLAASGMASADPFYMDIGTNFDGLTAPTGDKVCDTCTSLKNQFSYDYQSSSVITDQNGNTMIDAGDTIVSQGGLAVGSVANNLVQGFLPAEINIPSTSNSDNDYGGSWLLSFSFTDLSGTVVGPLSGGQLPLAYNSGTVMLYVFTAAHPAGVNFMNLNVTGGFNDVGGNVLVGDVDFSGTSAVGGYQDLFHSANQNCMGDDSFYALATTCGTDVTINVRLDFNTDDGVVNNGFIGLDPDGKALIAVSGDHNGSGQFSIPEPGTIALMGLALAGLGAARRRRSVA